MSPLGDERVNPRDIAAGAALAGRFHDVVISASKAIYDKQLLPNDRDSLRWAKSLLSAAGSTSSVLGMPSTNDLSGPSNPTMIIRRAVQSSAGKDFDATLRQLNKDVTSYLDGQRSAGLKESLQSLRIIFSMVSQMSLAAEVAAQSQQVSVTPWLPSTMTSIS